MQCSMPHQRSVFSAGRVSRVVHPVCLSALQSSRAARAAAGLRHSTPAGARHPARRLLAPCAAADADGSQHGGLPQQQHADAAEAAAKPSAEQRFRRSKAGPWNADVEAAVLQFWTEQGALLPEAKVQPEQQAEQRRIRSKIKRWAAEHPQHRDVQFLSAYMAEARAAAADSVWAEEPWRIPLFGCEVILRHRSPATVIHRVQSAKQQLAQHGICVSRDLNLTVGLAYGEATANKAFRLMLALGRLPISLDVARIVEKAPTLLNLNNVGAVLERRVAALQQLHPQLNVAQLCNRQPSLLTTTETTLAASWASFQTASGLGNDDIRAAMQTSPSILNLHIGVVAWRVQQVRAYDMARNSAAVGRRTSVSGLGRVVVAASYRVWRLCYLLEAKHFQCAAVTWVLMGEADFAARNPGYSSWLASNPIPAAAYRH